MKLNVRKSGSVTHLNTFGQLFAASATESSLTEAGFLVFVCELCLCVITARGPPGQVTGHDSWPVNSGLWANVRPLHPRPPPLSFWVARVYELQEQVISWLLLVHCYRVGPRALEQGFFFLALCVHVHALTCVCMFLFLCCGACVHRLGLPVCGSAGEPKWGRDDPRPGPHVLVCRPITHTSACVAPVLLSQGPGRFPSSMQFLEHRVCHHLLSLIICLCLNSVTQLAKDAARE